MYEVSVCIRGIQWQLGERFLERRSSIDKTMRLHQRPEIFDSTLAQPLYDNKHHFILFDSTSIITSVKGLVQVFREAVEIKSTYRDIGETSTSPIYDKIIDSDRFHIHPQIYVAQSNKVSDNNLPGK